MTRGVPRAIDYAEEVLSRVEIATDGCWRWTGYILPGGYGQIGRNLMVHRVVWEHLRGPIPAGMTLDHECHNRDLTCDAKENCQHRRCVNPDHLTIKSRGENTLAGRTPSALNAVKTRCSKGHEYTETNTYYRPNRWGRYCRICQAESNLRCRERTRAKSTHTAVILPLNAEAPVVTRRRAS